MWNIAPPFGIGAAVRHTASFIRPNRVARDLSGLPAVLGRFGPFEVRLAMTNREIRKAQRLRFKVFYEEGQAIPHQGAALTRRDICPFDKFCDHLLVIDREQPNRLGRKKPKVVGVYRLLRGEIAASHQGFYSETEFAIAPLLARHPGKRFLELGRSCVHPDYRSKRVIELLWRGLWSYAKHHRIDVLIGCASLPGVDPLALSMPLSFLHRHALASEQWSVRPLKGRGVDMAILDGQAIDARKGVAALPPLLKAYLRAGAKFGDGAVIDSQFRTTDVFTIMPLADLEERYISYYGGPMEMPDSYVA
jgi:L-ornithine Nalpha-acyltransferase